MNNMKHKYIRSINIETKHFIKQYYHEPMLAHDIKHFQESRTGLEQVAVLNTLIK